MNARVVLTLAALLLAGARHSRRRKGSCGCRSSPRSPTRPARSVTVTLDCQSARHGVPVPEQRGSRRGQGARSSCSSLTGIYVQHYTFDTDYAYPKGDIDGVRRQLNAPGWSRIVEARSKKENTDVDVFLLIDGDKAQGLAIIASEPREFTIVNIVGNIDLEKLHDLEGNFGVPEARDRDRQEAGASTRAGTEQNRSSQSFLLSCRGGDDPGQPRSRASLACATR